MDGAQKGLAPTKLWRAQPCPYCGIGMWWPSKDATRDSSREATLDHIVPRSWGGSHAVENLRLCCKLCNAGRAVTGDCPAALACVRAVIGRRPLGVIAEIWCAWTGRRTRRAKQAARRREKKKRQRAAGSLTPPSPRDSQHERTIDYPHHHNLAAVGHPDCGGCQAV